MPLAQRVLNQVSEGGPLAGIKVDAAAPSPTALDSDNPRPGPPRLIDDGAIAPDQQASPRRVRRPGRRDPDGDPAAGNGRRVGTQRDGGLLFDSVVGVDMTRIDDLPVTSAERPPTRPGFDDRGRGHARLSQPHRRRQGERPVGRRHRADVRRTAGVRVRAGTSVPRAVVTGAGRRRGLAGGERRARRCADLQLARAARAVGARRRASRPDLGINPSPYTALFVVARGLEHVTDVRTEINAVGYSTSAPETLITQVQRYLHVVELVLAGIGIIALGHRRARHLERDAGRDSRTSTRDRRAQGDRRDRPRRAARVPGRGRNPRFARRRRRRGGRVRSPPRSSRVS